MRLIIDNITAGIHHMKPKLNMFRSYLTLCRMQNFDIKDEETKMIETDFVKMRENTNFHVENLHSLLVLSRLISISKGLKTLDISSWELAKQLEFERVTRFEKKNYNEP
jgi:Mini-chromosome maintenance replisome factor